MEEDHRQHDRDRGVQRGEHGGQREELVLRRKQIQDDGPRPGGSDGTRGQCQPPRKALAVAVGLAVSMNAVLGVFGVWATLSGPLQLATGVRRWKHVGAQWAMILSDTQAAVVGAMFLGEAAGPATPTSRPMRRSAPSTSWSQRSG
nr:DUF308 domain-containing protein [Mycolicibacterium malmesburyense]CRL74109.1 integral membrane protein [Mycolicibacterium malmesburyense]